MKTGAGEQEAQIVNAAHTKRLNISKSWLLGWKEDALSLNAEERKTQNNERTTNATRGT